MNLVITQQPDVEPVTLADAKIHLRVDSTADDTLITSLITAARQWCEHYQNRTYITTGFLLAMEHFGDRRFSRGFSYPYANAYGFYGFFSPDLYLPQFMGWPGMEREIILPRPPMGEITQFQYIDTDGNLQTMNSSQYILDTNSTPARLCPAYNTKWPTTRRQPNAVTIIYTAGYGDTADTVPEMIKAAIKLMVGHLYIHREAISAETFKEVPLAVKSLLDMERIYNL